MTVPTIRALPTPPRRSDAPSDFSAKADALAAALPGFVADSNAQAAFVDQRAADADQSAQSALNAVAIAGAAQGLPALAGNALKFLRINANANGVFWDVVQQATATVAGILEIATSAEAIAGTDSVRAIVPSALAAVIANLALGTMSKQSSGAVAITGGSISGIADLAIADGGTGASTAAQALANLGGAPLASPALTGTPTAPTAGVGTNNTQIANTAFMQAGIAALISGASGDLAATPAGLAAVLQGAMMTYAVGSGSANAHTATYTPAVSTLVDGMVLRFRAANANTGAATFSPNGLAAKPIVKRDLSALTGGEISTGRDVWLQWNAALDSWVMTSGGQDILDSVRIDVASAATVDLTVAAPNTRHINITGGATINDFVVDAGRTYFAEFSGTPVLTNSASIVTNVGADITVAEGGFAVIKATATNVVSIDYSPPIAATTTDRTEGRVPLRKV